MGICAVSALYVVQAVLTVDAFTCVSLVLIDSDSSFPISLIYI